MIWEFLGNSEIVVSLTSNLNPNPFISSLASANNFMG